MIAKPFIINLSKEQMDTLSDAFCDNSNSEKCGEQIPLTNYGVAVNTLREIAQNHGENTEHRIIASKLLVGLD